MDREGLIDWLTRSGSLKSPLVVTAFKLVDRKDFCIPEYKDYAYEDRALPILENQTISQPTTVAMMTEALELKPGDKVLEIGTGCGYQAAVLAEIVGKKGNVFTIERIPELVKFAKKNLKGYTNIEVIEGDGSKGLAKEAPFDGIIVTAGAPKVPAELKQQLKVNGNLVIPVGAGEQRMLVITRTRKGFEEKDLGPFVFVPLIGGEGWKD